MSYAILGAFAMTWFVSVVKILQSNMDDSHIPYVMAFHIVSMATIANSLSLILNWGGICVDILG